MSELVKVVTITAAELRELIRDEVQAALNGLHGNTQEDRMLTVNEAAAYLNYSPSWVYHNWRKVGGRKFGSKGLRFSRRELEKWATSRKL